MQAKKLHDPSDPDIQGILLSLEQYNRGEYVTHEEAMVRIKATIKRVATEVKQTSYAQAN